MRFKTKIFLQHDLFHGLRLLFIREGPRGTDRVLEIGNWRDLAANEQPPRESVINVPGECGQQLIDQLWQMGYRPSVGISSAGQDEAQKAHIGDLRAILFSLLKIEREK